MKEPEKRSKQTKMENKQALADALYKMFETAYANQGEGDRKPSRKKFLDGDFNHQVVADMIWWMNIYQHA